MNANNRPDDADGQSEVAVALVRGLVAADVTSVRRLFHGPADIDDPSAGRQIDGGFEHLVRNWAPAIYGAVTGTELVHSTSGASGRFAGTEMLLTLDRDGKEKKLELMVVSEFLPDGGLVRSRFYYRLARLTGVHNQRTRILPEQPLHLEDFPPAVARYQDALTARSADSLADAFSVDGSFDGHGESREPGDLPGMGVYHGRDNVRAAMQQMFGNIAQLAGDSHRHPLIEKLNVFSDQTTTVMEFNVVHPNHPVNRVSAGAAAYERDDEDLIKEARIYDEM